MNNFNRLSRVSRRARMVGWIILTLLIMAALFGFFSSSLGRNVLLICCGSGILVVIVGILSEMGMRRPR
jgi:hypothetical protein